MLRSAWCLVLFLTTQCNGDMSFLVIGDWGVDPYATNDTSLADQGRVRDSMEGYVAQYGTDFIVTTADNFYPQGVVSVDDPVWDLSWADFYNTPSLQNLVWYPTLGNHDHAVDMRGFAQVNKTSVEPRWYLPSFYHSFEIERTNTRALFVMIDSEIMVNPVYNQSKEDQLDWLDQTLAAAALENYDWTIAACHHPPRSCGPFGNEDMYLDVLPILEQHNVDFLLSGHDHSMQHIVNNNGIAPEFFVSGVGGEDVGRPGPIECNDLRNEGYTDLFFQNSLGFLSIELANEEATFKFVSDDQSILYTYVHSRAPPTH